MIEEEKEITKTIDGKETKQKKTWKYFKLSEYKWVNYLELKVSATLEPCGTVLTHSVSRPRPPSWRKVY